MSIRVQHAQHAPRWSQAGLQIQTDLRDLFAKLAVLTSSVGLGVRRFSRLAAKGVTEGVVKGVAVVVVAVGGCCEEVSRTVDRYIFACPFRKDKQKHACSVHAI